MWTTTGAYKEDRRQCFSAAEVIETMTAEVHSERGRHGDREGGVCDAHEWHVYMMGYCNLFFDANIFRQRGNRRDLAILWTSSTEISQPLTKKSYFSSKFWQNFSEWWTFLRKDFIRSQLTTNHVWYLQLNRCNFPQWRNEWSVVFHVNRHIESEVWPIII